MTERILLCLSVCTHGTHCVATASFIFGLKEIRQLTENVTTEDTQLNRLCSMWRMWCLSELKVNIKICLFMIGQGIAIIYFCISSYKSKSCLAAFLLLSSSQILWFSAGMLMMGVAHAVITVKGTHLASHGALSESPAWGRFWAVFFIEVRSSEINRILSTNTWGKACTCSSVKIRLLKCLWD